MNLTRVTEARKTAGVLKGVWKGRTLSMEAKMGMYNGIVVPTGMYGSEVWISDENTRHRMNVMEMACLRSMCGVTRMERLRNVEIRRRCGNTRSMGDKTDQSVLRWYGHMERMENKRLGKKIYVSDVARVRKRGRPRKRWSERGS
jgi:hypothetical protein